MSFQNEKITVLYGSQTGNAQDVAERIWRESKRFYFSCSVRSMDEYNVLELVTEQCVIFICSTTGQGEEPENMKTFWKFLLRKSLPADSLVNIRYGVLGLGDSSYTKFNFVAKRLYKRLLQLGAKPLLPLALGDDQHDLGYDAEADPWIEKVWINLLEIYPLPKNVQPLDRNMKILPRWNVTSKLLSNINDINKTQSLYYSTRKTSDFYATVLENERITTEDHFQDVRLIKLKTNGEEYLPGDLVVLRPKNLLWQVEQFQNVLKTNGINISPDEVFEISQNDPHIPVPDVLKYKVTFQQLCEEYWDLMSIPRRYTFSILAQITDSELENEKCIEFTTAEGQDDLYTYVNRPKRNIVEVLNDFPHATKNLSKEMLFEILPPIKPREFSIASSCKTHRNEVHVLLAVVKFKTKLVKERFGLCSNYLADLQKGDSITAWIKHGSFRFPSNDTPVVLVGPGTGVAPFRNYIFDRVSKNQSTSENTLLFFGCRNKYKDFLCKEDFKELEKDKKIHLICAFSRDQEHKIYVQDQILKNGKAVWNILKNNGSIFVAGNAKNMPQAVKNAFIDVLQQYGIMSEEQAIKFIENMEKSNRYQTECWS